MHFKIVHNTKYAFSDEVFFEPHYLRFKPRNSVYLELKSFKLEVFPNPAGISEQSDPENNFVHFCWFNDTHKLMDIRLEFEVESKEFNPFNFLIYPDKFSNTPFEYSDDMKKILKPSLKFKKIGKSLYSFGEDVLKSSNYKTIDFLANLTLQIHNNFTVETRLKGKPYQPDKLFKFKRGSCRDLAWMELQLLRNMGFAARFVSGYYFLDAEYVEFELHAWLEVFIPGGGWIGVDPSHGMLTGNSHIQVAASSDYKNTMPVSGTVRGKAISKLHTELNIEKIK